MILRVFCLGVAAGALLFSPVIAQTASPAAPESSPGAVPTSSAATPAAVPAPAAAPTAPSTQATEPPPASAPPTPAPTVVASEVHSGPIPPPPPGKGQVVFFRTFNYFGAADWFKVRENGAALGKLTSNAYFVKITDPGPHTYTGEVLNHNVLHLEVDDGETYYVKGSMTMGVLLYDAFMAPSDEATFDKAYRHLKLAVPPDPADVKKAR